jgi:hypothetical protein
MASECSPLELLYCAALQEAAGKLADLSPALYMRALDLLCAKSGEAIWLMEQKSESNQVTLHFGCPTFTWKTLSGFAA